MLLMFAIATQTKKIYQQMAKIHFPWGITPFPKCSQVNRLDYYLSVHYLEDYYY